jgi:hypothetical protein
VIVKIRPPNQREMALPGGVIVNALEDGKTSEQLPFNSRSSISPRPFVCALSIPAARGACPLLFVWYKRV